jgi:hypothetical protein
VALTKAQRAERQRRAVDELRSRWRGPQRDRRVTLTLQDHRRRPRISGWVAYVATSGAYVLLDDGGEDPLHVPTDIIRAVR